MTTITPPSPPFPPADASPRQAVVAGRGTRGALLGLGSVFTILALAAAVFRLLTMIAFDQHFENLTFTPAELGPVTTASIRNTTGNINVVGTAGAEAHVEVDVGDGLFRARHREVIDGQTLTLDASCPFSALTRCRVHHNLQLPAGLGVEAYSRIGNMTVADMEGDVAIDGRFGGVTAERLAGPLTVNHRFGEINARQLDSPSVSVDTRFGAAHLGFATAPQNVQVRSRFGEVAIELPDDGTAYRVIGSSNFGDRNIEIRVDPDSDHVLDVDSAFGAITVRYAR